MYWKNTKYWEAARNLSINSAKAPPKSSDLLVGFLARVMASNKLMKRIELLFM